MLISGFWKLNFRVCPIYNLFITDNSKDYESKDGSIPRPRRKFSHQHPTFIREIKNSDTEVSAAKALAVSGNPLHLIPENADPFGRQRQAAVSIQNNRSAVAPVETDVRDSPGHTYKLPNQARLAAFIGIYTTKGTDIGTRDKLVIQIFFGD